MSNSFRYRFTLVIATVLVVAVVSMICQLMQKPAIIQGATITKNMKISGRIQWVENKPQSMDSFGYAILKIDGTPRSVTNILPARFNIDTTALSNGQHKIQVYFYNNSGVPVEVTTIVTVNNPTSESLSEKVPVGDPAVRENEPDTVPYTSKIIKQKSGKGDKTAYSAKNRFNIILKDKPLDLAVAAYNKKNRVMVLLRLLTSAADGELDWSRTSGSAIINDKKITFSLNSRLVDINGKKVKALLPVTMRNGRVFAPVRLWRDLSNGDLSYEPKTRSVYLYR